MRPTEDLFGRGLRDTLRVGGEDGRLVLVVEEGLDERTRPRLSTSTKPSRTDSRVGPSGSGGSIRRDASRSRV